jgi:ribosomal protein S18 acetylase RimI-like enzyme
VSHTIDYRLGETPGAHDLWTLYRSAGVAADSEAELHRSVAQCSWIVTAWDEGKLVGLLRVLTDGVWVAYIQELLVHADFHHQGVGKELFDRYDEEFGHFRHQLIVTETDWVRAKFLKRGFHEEPDALSRLRPLA